MTSAPQSLREAIGQAWKITCAHLPSGANPKETNRLRSKRWLENLGYQLLELEKDKRPRRRSRGNEAEFLFDICIDDGDLAGRRLWAVEIEFERRNANIKRDFCKLLWADVDNRLFVYCDSQKLTAINDLCSKIRMSAGNLYRCRLPHPDEWENGKALLDNLEQYERGKWLPPR